MPYDPDKHHRRSIRLKGYNYTQAGAYFVTLCAWQRECLFGEILGGEMQLNDYGRVLEEEWLRTAEVRPNVDLDAFVIMPNHLHGVIVICDQCRRGEPLARPYGPYRPCRPTAPAAPTGTVRIVAGSLGAIIGQIKSITTKRINALRNAPGQPVWQRNYHEHIIHSETALNNIRQYIAHNPMLWIEDEENPTRIHNTAKR